MSIITAEMVERAASIIDNGIGPDLSQELLRRALKSVANDIIEICAKAAEKTPGPGSQINGGEWPMREDVASRIRTLKTT